MTRIRDWKSKNVLQYVDQMVIFHAGQYDRT